MNYQARFVGWQRVVGRWHTSRTFACFLACGLIALIVAATNAETPGEIELTKDVIYPALRRSASPSGGREVAVNPPALLWPRTLGNDIRYDVRLSQDASFPPGKSIVSAGQPWALFNPHKKLARGTWYWQYADSSKANPSWSDVHVFRVADTTRVFETRTAMEMLAGCPRSHPRLLARADQLATFRKRVKELDAAIQLVKMGEKRLNLNLPAEDEATPKRKGKDGQQSQKLASDASKELGQRVWSTVLVLSKAYLITGQERFGREAVRWAAHVAKWDRNGVSGKNNFGDMFCMEAMVLAYDSCYNLLSEGDKQTLLKGIKARAGHFFSKWFNRLEVSLQQGHDWQRILHRAIQAAVVTLGELPEAAEWLTYGYEVWLARAPSAGCDDGGWMVGTNYNGVEGETLSGIPALFQDLTGDNLFDTPFYRNNLYYLIYCQPPQSYGDGFGDAHEMEKGPRAFHIAYVESLGGQLGDPYASWYLQWSRKEETRRESKKRGLDWTGLGWGKVAKPPLCTGPFTLPQARPFRQAGVVAMHTDLAHPQHDLFVGFRSSPWGSYAHAQADQNTFNIVVGGERLFYASGYKMPITDAHQLGFYKHTRGHNGILVDGKGQPFGTEAYGWIPRYLHGERITYCVGDASRAYDTKPTTDDEETLPDLKGRAKYRGGHAGLKRFRRHVAFLRPDTVVVYDDLMADHDAEWSWLLHSMEPIRVEAGKQRLFGSAGKARSRVDLLGSVPLRCDVADKFPVPAVNWRGRAVAGEELSYEDNQWHFTAASGHKTPAMRFLAVVQIRQGGDTVEFTEATPDQDAWVRASQWRIRAELDATRKPYLEIQNVDGTAGLILGKSHLTLGEKSHDGQRPGSTLLVEKSTNQWQVQEAVDELPDAAR
jgi:hypothetical protein